jgi:alpha-glucosidase
MRTFHLRFRLVAYSVAGLVGASLAPLACGGGSGGGAPADAGLLEEDARANDSGSDAGPARDASADATVSDATAGGDAAASDPCREDALGALRPNDGSAIALGDFRVTANATGGLSVTHAAAPTQELWGAANGEGALRAYRAGVTHEEHQGSFTITEDLANRCVSPRFAEVRASTTAALLRGGFADTASGCAQLRFELRLCAARPGHLTFALSTNDPAVNALAVRVASPANERLWGAGEQFVHDTLNLRGRLIPIVAQEGGVGRGHQPISGAVNLASPGSAGDESSTYAPSSHLVTNRGRAFVFDDPEVAMFDLTGGASFELREHAPVLHGRLLRGSGLPELTERLTEFTGRMDPLPAWSQEGLIVALARPIDDAKPILERMLARGVRIAGVWNQTWSGKVTTFVGEQVLWNWVQDPNAHPGWSAFVQWNRDRGMRTLCYVNPMLRDVPAEYGAVRRNLFQEAKAANHFVKRANGADYIFPLTAFDVGLLDLTRPETRTWVKSLLKEELLARGGCSGWMADFAEALPFDAVLASGVSAATYHNRYPEDWATLQREAIAEAGRTGDVLVFNRSGHTRTPGTSLLLWEGDQLTTWDKYDGLTSALHGLLNAGLSGVAYVHSDIGGYTALSRFGLGYSRERELQLRWTELSAFTALLRTHEGNAPAANAQVYTDDGTIDQAARFSKVFAALAPYRAELAVDARARGWPLARTLAFHYGDDEALLDVDDEFLLGPSILVAPTLAKCLNPLGCSYERTVTFPKGTWVHLWSGRAYGSVAGSSTATVAAPIGQPAVFYRADWLGIATLRTKLAGFGIAIP